MTARFRAEDGANLTKEQSFFLKMLTDHLEKKPTAVPDGLDWSHILKYCRDHKLGGICWKQCGAYLRTHSETAEAYKRMEREFQGTVFLCSTMEYELRAVSEAFQAEQIPFVVIKGSILSRYYPEPLLRTMGDIDLLVKAEDAERIQPVMRDLGYAIQQSKAREWDYSKRSVTFELQAELLHETAVENPAQRDYLNDFWSHTEPDPESGGLRLDWNFHLLYLIAHIAKHLRKSGIGFRQFFDLAVLLRTEPSLFRWDVFQREAERIGLLDFAKTCLTLCETWFRVPSPLPAAELTPALIEDVTQTVFQNGVFGFQSTERRFSRLERERERSGLPLPLLKLRVFRKLLFPSYKNLCTLEKFRGLRGRPLLLPWYWGKRIVSALKRKRGGGMAKNLLVIQEEDLDRSQDQLKRLGL